MGIKIKIYEGLHWLFQHVFFPWHRWWPPVLGLVPLIIHRDLLNEYNLLPAPLPPTLDGDNVPLQDPKYRSDDGKGTDKYNPTASMEGAPIGRNCPTVAKHLRSPTGDPDVQLVAQRLLARDSFTPAGDQLNVLAAAWIQAMVHDWIGHYDDNSDTGGVVLDKGEASGCPMSSFKFRKTRERPDGHYDNFRTMWWDASFLYGNNKAEADSGRAHVGGRLKTNLQHPDTLPNDGNVNTTGDNKNSWVGVALLQEIFLKEHNAIVEDIAKQNPGLSDDELYGVGKNVIAALVAKIHTTDWTVELLKTRCLEIGMITNWDGLPKALGLPSWAGTAFKLIGQEKAENHGVPFCLTEEFAAVYRLHPMLPPGLVVGPKRKEFIPLEDLVGDEGRTTIRAKPERVMDFWDSVLFYPCGNMSPHNYPTALRKVAPTEDDGKGLPDTEKIDLAAIDLYRDRERGIPRFNDFRRAIRLKPFKTWLALTGEKTGTSPYADELEAVYGAAPHGIERCDLLVGDLYENKIKNFAISETSFIIFLVMASRRLEADPFLNELYNSTSYTQAGLDWIENNNGFKDLLVRHYPTLADKIPEGQSAFKPYGTKDDASKNAWKKAVEDNVIDSNIKSVWADVKQKNKEFYGKLATEATSLLE